MPAPLLGTDDSVAQLIRATTTVGQHYYAAAAEVGLTVQEARLLFVLASNPRNMLGLTSAMRVPKSTMTGLISRMESGGLVVRERDPNDGRALVATPTALGRDVASEFASQLARRVSSVLSGLGPRDQHELAGLLSELLLSLETHAG